MPCFTFVFGVRRPAHGTLDGCDLADTNVVKEHEEVFTKVHASNCFNQRVVNGQAEEKWHQWISLFAALNFLMMCRTPTESSHKFSVGWAFVALDKRQQSSQTRDVVQLRHHGAPQDVVIRPMPSVTAPWRCVCVSETLVTCLTQSVPLECLPLCAEFSSRQIWNTTFRPTRRNFSLQTSSSFKSNHHEATPACMEEFATLAFLVFLQTTVNRGRSWLCPPI